MIETIAIVGSGNGGKAAAVDLTLQGKRVRLFEFPEFGSSIEALRDSRVLEATGAVEGRAQLDCVTNDIAEALRGADTIMVCTQAAAHENVARTLAPHLSPEQLVIVNPGSTGGSLEFAQIFRTLGLVKLPTLVETSTLTYGCRAHGASVNIAVKPTRVLYGTLPGSAMNHVGPELETLYPGLVRGASVLHAGLNNGNPVIHPPIALLNGARIENEGPAMKFYKDGVSPSVARLIRLLDEERMALLEALGYPAQPEPLTCVQQGYAESEDYFECYSRGPGFIGFNSPENLDNRYFHEDIGMGLVMLSCLGDFLGVPTPTCRAFIDMGQLIMGRPYLKEGKRTLTSLGLGGLSLQQLKDYLETGELPS
jgi:opine dehydrogenase